MGNITLIYLISLFIVVVHNADSLISDQRACFDEECAEFLSKARTLLSFPSNDEHILSFKANENVKVFSKSAGSNPELWGVEINGKRGYVPKKFIREMKIVKKPKINVLTELYELDKDGKIVLKKIKDKNVTKKQNGEVNVKSTPTEALPSNDKLKPSSVTDASFMPSVEGLKLEATPTYQVIDGTTIPNDSYETSTQAVHVDEAPVTKQPDYEVNEENEEEDEEMVDSEDDEDEFYEGSLEEDDGEELDKTDDASTIVETSQEIKAKSDEQNILPPQTVQLDKDVNVNGAERIDGVLDNSVNNSIIDTVNNNINELPIVNSLTNNDPKSNTGNLDSTNPKDSPVMEVSDDSQNVVPIVENIDIGGLKEIENVLNDSEPIADSVNVAVNNISDPPKENDGANNDSHDGVLVEDNKKVSLENNGANNDSNSPVEVQDTKNVSSEKTESQESTSAEINPDSFVNAATAEIIANLGISENINADNDALNISASAEVVGSDVTITSPSVESVSSDDSAITSNESLNNIPKDSVTIETMVSKDTVDVFNSESNVVNNSAEVINEETGNAIPVVNNESLPKEIQINLNESNDSKEEIKADESVSAEFNKNKDSFLPNINVNEPHLNLNSNEDIKTNNNDPVQEQKQDAPYLNNAYLGSLSPLSQLVHRSLPDSYYSNENDSFNSDVNETKDDPHHESTTMDTPIEKESISYKTEEVGTQYPPVENTFDTTREPIIDPYKKLYQNNENFDLPPKAEIIQEYATEKYVSGNEDTAESSNSVFSFEEIPLDSSSENDSSESMFRGFYKSLTGLFKPGETESVPLNNENILNPVASDILKTTNDYEAQNKMNVQHDHDHSQDFLSAIFPESGRQCNAEDRLPSGWTDISTDLIFWMVISAVSVLMFTLGFYYLENRKHDGKLLAMVNSLQKDLLCSSKENIILREDLGVTKEKLFGIEDSSFGSNEMVACLKKELSDSEQTICDLQDKLASAEEELANSTEAALELQSILDEQLNCKDTSSASLTFTVTNLQSQLDDQQTTMNMTKAQLSSKVEENELLLMKIADIGNRNISVAKELTELNDKLKEVQEENENKAQHIRELSSNQEKILQKMEEQRVVEVKEIQSKMRHAKNEMDSAKVLLKARIQEVTSLQENLKLLKLDDKNFAAIVDISQTKAELMQAVSENSILAEKLEMEKTAQAELSERMNEQEAKMSQMKEQLNEAEQNALQSTSRLEVLTNYFNQKEADLLKELSTKEALWLSQQGEAMSTVDKIQSLQQEIQQYKQMSESVKRELAEQEASWRARVAALEKKAHEQWLARRAAERTSQAMEKEAQALRQRLSGPSPNDKRVVSPLNVMDGVPDVGMMLPPGMGPMPPMALPLPLPMGFLPPPSAMMLPPPLPHLPPLPPHRPPPLGRLSSPPPNNNRYSPESRYSPDRYSPDTRRSTPQHNRMRSPFSPTEARRRGYNHNGRYEDDRYYDSGDDRRLRRYDETETDLSPPPSPPPPRRLPPPQRHNNHNHKGISSGSGQSS